MKKKQFKTESQKLLDMMINSIYTHKEIFLRELISNASDACDKLYFRSLTDDSIQTKQGDFEIRLTVNKEERTLSIADNGCGMTEADLENNLGTIAKSGSFDFKRENAGKDGVDIIGQFGVGFYSAFMVADKITVTSKAYGADSAFVWESEGVDGYTINAADKADVGTEIVLHLKDDTEDEKYSEYLENFRLQSLVKKYSDYIRYPIKMEAENERLKEGTKDEYETVKEMQTLNSMIPIWKKSQADVTAEEYNRFYSEKFFDYEAPLKVVTQKSEGTATYTALLFFPSHTPFNYYTKEYEKGLELYSGGVMIMEKCADLLPDYFSFVKGLVDSSDLSLNISREMLQHDRQLKVMAKAIEKKIKSELEKMLKDERENYEKLFGAFGLQLKYGLYTDYGMHKDVLSDLVMFKTSAEGNKLKTLKEYTDAMKEGQEAILYASGESVEQIDRLPQVENAKARGFEVLYCTDDIDEFALKMLGKYADKEFKNVTADASLLETEEEKKAVEDDNKSAEDMLKFMKEQLGDKVFAVRFSASLKGHPVSLSSEGELSVEMEKTLNKMPGADGMAKAQTVLEINREHPIAAKLKALYESDKEKLASYAKILFAEARLINGLSIDNPTEFADLVAELM